MWLNFSCCYLLRSCLYWWMFSLIPSFLQDKTQQLVSSKQTQSIDREVFVLLTAKILISIKNRPSLATLIRLLSLSLSPLCVTQKKAARTKKMPARNTGGGKRAFLTVYLRTSSKDESKASLRLRLFCMMKYMHQYKQKR